MCVPTGLALSVRPVGFYYVDFKPGTTIIPFFLNFTIRIFLILYEIWVQRQLPTKSLASA